MNYKIYYRGMAVSSVMFILLIGAFTQQVVAQSASVNSDVAQRGDALQTQIASTAQALQTNVASTVQAGQGNVQATVESAQTDVASTVQVGQGNIQMTVQAYQTQVYVTADALRTEVFATVEAVQTEIVATAQGITQEINDALNVVGIDYDADAETVTLTTTIDESQVNDALDIVLEASGYDVEASVDLITNGLVITLDNYTLENGQDVTVVLTFTLVQDAITSTYGLDLTSVTINGRAIPTDELENEMDEILVVLVESYVEDIFDGSTSDFSGDLPADATSENLMIENIVITDDFVAVLVVIDVSGN